jgi:CRISPR-associated protein Cmr3
MQYDRIGRGNVYVQRASVSITGTIQPGILKTCLGVGEIDSGLAARFLWDLPPKRMKTLIRRKVSNSVKKAYKDIAFKLMDLSYEQKPAIINLKPDANDMYEDFYNNHQVYAQDFSGAKASAMYKMEGTCGRIALILHCIKNPEGSECVFLTGQTMSEAIAMTRWFMDSSLRVYNVLEKKATDPKVQNNLKEIKKKFSGKVTVREWSRLHYSGKGGTCKARAELDEMVTLGVLMHEHKKYILV